MCVYESFNDWGDGDTTIPSPGWSPKQHLPGIGLHDLLHDRRACPDFNSFYQGRLVKYVPGRPGRDYFRAIPSQKGDKFATSSTPPYGGGGMLPDFFLFSLFSRPRAGSAIV